MDDNTELPHDQLILNASETHDGIIFCPFSDQSPSDYAAQKAFSGGSSLLRRAPISGGGSGWISMPDTGRTMLSKELPVGDARTMMIFAALWTVWKTLKRKRILLLLCCVSLLAGPSYAGVSSLLCSPTAGGTQMTVVPTITSVPDGTVSVCWGLYYDAACAHEVPDIHFHRAVSGEANAVWFTTPTTAGTYYIQTSLHTGSLCGGLMESSYISPVSIYPADADIILERNAQAPAMRVDISDAATKQAYAVMRFSKTAINDASRTPYERYNYFISFPFDVKIGDIYGIGTVGTDWRILYYDGQGRAEEGFFSERTDNWMMFADTEDVLRAGEGYLLQLNTFSMAESNDAIWSNNADVATLFFPAQSAISDLETTDAILPALGDAYRCTIDLSASLGAEGDRRTKDSYWRCIGVPSFTVPSAAEGLAYLYVWNREDNSLHVVSGEGFTFEPMQAYLVQNGNVITWRNVTRPASVVARQKENHAEEIELVLLQNETFIDRTYIRLSDELSVTEDFDFGRDLSKELNAGQSNIYTLLGYERLAANCFPFHDSVISMPIGIQIDQAGEYRVHVQRNNVPCTLWDRESGVRLTDYTVYLEPGTYEGRFSVEIGDSTPTGIQNPEISSQPSGVRKVLIDGILYIEKDGKRYLIR